MQFNLKTTLNACPNLSPSILDSYVTKEQLEERNFVDKSTLDSILEDFVRDVEVEGTDTIYGRIKGAWIPVIDIPEQAAGIMCWGMIETATLDAQQLLTLSRQNFLQGVNDYSVEALPKRSGYFWFAATAPIKEVVADNGLAFRQPVVEAEPISINYKGQPLTFHCYRTQKLAALPNISYKFRVNL